MKIDIVNVVATANLSQPLDLAEAGKLKGALYDSDTYHCVYFTNPKMFCKVSVFKTGKMISIGTRTPSEAEHDLKHVAQRLAKAGHIKPVKIETKLQNIVATIALGTPINLEKVAQTVRSTIYEPEQFPGAIWRPKDFNASILIFASGRLVVAGLKSITEYRRLSSFIKEKLTPYVQARKIAESKMN